MLLKHNAIRVPAACHSPDDDVILINVSTQLAAVQDPTAPYHHTALACLGAQQGREAVVRQRAQRPCCHLLTALQAQRWGEPPYLGPILKEHWYLG